VELFISAFSSENGTHSSSRCNLDGVLTLGRGPESPLLLDGTGISREHLRLDSEGANIFITDLSSNGTWLNAERLMRGERSPLTPADVIKIPGFEVRVDWNISVAPQTLPHVVPEAAAKSTATSGLLKSVGCFAATFSKVERCRITLALSTLALVMFYLAG
jgi:pSer/pThr/pTyr-binding forkhead associated (FHA) protein